MYQDIQAPWSYPRFPEPPREFLAPEKFLELVSETVLTHHTKINHPFCVKLVRGEWNLKQLQAWAVEEGRDPASIALTFRAPMEVRSPRAKAPGGDRPLFQGTPAEVLGDLRRYEALGVSHVVFDPVRPDLRAVLDNIARFAEDVRPTLAKGRRASR